MVQIGNVPEILEVKNLLEQLVKEGSILEWELPYENLLTRLDAAIFFLSPSMDSQLESIWKKLEEIPRLSYKKNEEMRLSQLQWQFSFTD